MRKGIQTNQSEFELDLAPLLAVMVKLVPVLLISSAFVQLSIVESNFPPSVQNAIQYNQEQSNLKSLSLEIDHSNNLLLTVVSNTDNQKLPIKNVTNKIDKIELNTQLVKIKTKYPDLFTITIYPKKQVKYQELVILMDQLRIDSINHRLFEFKDPQSNKIEKTTYLFPNITMGQATE